MSRKLLVAVSSAALVLVGSSLLPSADAQVPNEFTIEKVVEGPVPDGAVFEVEFACEPDLSGSPEGAPSGTVRFDQDGNPLDPNSFFVGLFQTCTATETVTNGAQVSYSCVASLPVEGDEVSCLDDQTVRYGDVIGAEGIITVTNTFEEEPPPPPDVEPDTDVPDVVDASPAFTG